MDGKTLVMKEVEEICQLLGNFIFLKKLYPTRYILFGPETSLKLREDIMLDLFFISRLLKYCTTIFIRKIV